MFKTTHTFQINNKQCYYNNPKVVNGLCISYYPIFLYSFFDTPEKKTPRSMEKKSHQTV